MAEFPALPLWTDAYISDTQHLSNEEHGVYLRLLMFAWRSRDCSLPDDDKRLAIMVGVTPKKWEKLKPTIMSFWEKDGPVWRQKNLTKQRSFVSKSRAQKSAAGKASVKSKRLKNNDTGSTAVATGEVTGEQRDGQQPIPIPIEEKEEANASSKKKPATRLPDDWELAAEDRIWALTEKWDYLDICEEADKFRDYWIGKPGKDGLKLDWSATWRNWMRNSGRKKITTGETINGTDHLAGTGADSAGQSGNGRGAASGLRPAGSLIAGFARALSDDGSGSGSG